MATQLTEHVKPAYPLAPTALRRVRAQAALTPISFSPRPAQRTAAQGNTVPPATGPARAAPHLAPIAPQRQRPAPLALPLTIFSLQPARLPAVTGNMEIALIELAKHVVRHALFALIPRQNALGAQVHISLSRITALLPVLQGPTETPRTESARLA